MWNSTIAIYKKMNIILKWIFDRLMALVGLVALFWLYPIVAILIKLKMPGGPVFFVQKRVGKDGKLFNCHKFRTMRVNDSVDGNRLTVKGDRLVNETESQNGTWPTVSVAGDSRITPLGAKLRHWKLDELPGLWDVLRGKMSFVGPRPDVPGYADKLEGSDRDVLKLRPGITGPATLKYRLEDEMIANKVREIENGELIIDNLPKDLAKEELAVWYNDNVIYPDKVRLNKYYYEHYSFWKDIQMIVCTVLGKQMEYAGEMI